MNLLALDTATEACSLAVAVDARVCVRHVVAGRDQSSVLLPLLHELMAEAGIGFADLDGIVCGIGPGSFAGLRVGVGFVKGLAVARDLPVVPVTSLATLAQGALRRTGISRALACIDARMGEVYAGAFERDASGLMQPSGAPRVCKPEALELSLSAPWVVAGTGWGTYGAVLRERSATAPAAEEPLALPEAMDALALARPAFIARRTIGGAALEPVYLRDDVALNLEQQAALRSRRKLSSST